MAIPEFPLQILQQPQDQSVAHGSTATFTISAQGNGVLTYQWFTTDHAIAKASGFVPLPGAEVDGFWMIVGATAASYTTPVVVVSDNGFQFRCLVINTETISQRIGGVNVTATPQQTQQVLFTETFTRGAILLVS